MISEFRILIRIMDLHDSSTKFEYALAFDPGEVNLGVSLTRLDYEDPSEGSLSLNRNRSKAKLVKDLGDFSKYKVIWGDVWDLTLNKNFEPGPGGLPFSLNRLHERLTDEESPLKRLLNGIEINRFNVGSKTRTLMVLIEMQEGTAPGGISGRFDLMRSSAISSFIYAHHLCRGYDVFYVGKMSRWGYSSIPKDLSAVRKKRFITVLVERYIKMGNNEKAISKSVPFVRRNHIMDSILMAMEALRKNRIYRWMRNNDSGRITKRIKGQTLGKNLIKVVTRDMKKRRNP